MAERSGGNVFEVAKNVTSLGEKLFEKKCFFGLADVYGDIYIHIYVVLRGWGGGGGCGVGLVWFRQRGGGRLCILICVDYKSSSEYSVLTRLTLLFSSLILCLHPPSFSFAFYSKG